MNQFKAKRILIKRMTVQHRRSQALRFHDENNEKQGRKNGGRFPTLT